MGQLPSQALQPCTDSGFALASLPFGVKLAKCFAQAARTTMLEVGTPQAALP